MKKIYSVVIFAALLTMVMFIGTVTAENDGFGPAPNSGDGDPDGSGFDRTDWPNEESPAEGPAPNSGDGVPNGSGF